MRVCLYVYIYIYGRIYYVYCITYTIQHIRNKVDMIHTKTYAKTYIHKHT